MTPYGPYVPHHPDNPRSYPFCDLVLIPYLCRDHPVTPLGPGPVMPNARSDAYDDEPQLGASPFHFLHPRFSSIHNVCVYRRSLHPATARILCPQEWCEASAGYSWRMGAEVRVAGNVSW